VNAPSRMAARIELGLARVPPVSSGEGLRAQITGGLLLEHFSWSSVFFATIPVAVLALALGAWLVPASRDPAAPRLDLAGFALSAAGVGAVVYTTIEAPARGWLAPLTLAGYGAGTALLAAFAAWERRAGEPMLDITLFRDIRFSAASFSIAAAFFGLFGFIFLITQYFQLVHGYSPLSAGIRTLPFALGVGAAAPAAPVTALAKDLPWATVSHSELAAM
jgi:MFS family permease